MSETSVVEEAKPQTLPPANPQLSFDILPYIKTAQNQNGLRRAEYGRYRTYCATRLRRIRRGVAYLHGKGKYVGREVVVSEVREVRWVEMMVMEAERAWAGAMESKEAEESGERGKRAKYHSLRRLRKAVAWSKKLVALCEEVCDNRTQLEAQAYAAWMGGNEMFERERWAEVKVPLLQAKTIYEQLASAVAPEQTEYYAIRVEELTTLYRYAMSKTDKMTSSIGGGAGNASSQDTVGNSSSHDASDIRSLMTLASDDPALKLLQSKLSSVIEATQRARAEQSTDLSWFGKKINIKSPSLRLAFVKAQETMAEVESMSSKKESSDSSKKESSDSSRDASSSSSSKNPLESSKSSKKKTDSLGHKLAAYDRLFQVWSDTKLKIRDERSAALQMANNETLLKDLELMMNYATYTEQNQMIVRNLLLVSSIEKKIDAIGFENLHSVKPDEVVRMYESTLQLLSETEQLREMANTASSDIDIAAIKAAKATNEGREFGYKAIRCYYLALSYAQVEKWSDSVSLINRAKNYAELALKLLANADPKLAKRLQHLALQARSALIWIQAKAALLSSQPSSADETSSASLDAVQLQAGLLADLKRWDAQTKLVDFPPLHPTPFPQKPVLFDLAFSSFQAPDLSTKAKAPKSGFFSSFWRS